MMLSGVTLGAVRGGSTGLFQNAQPETRKAKAHAVPVRIKFVDILFISIFPSTTPCFAEIAVKAFPVPSVTAPYA